jgi:hypothetical protein
MFIAIDQEVFVGSSHQERWITSDGIREDYEELLVVPPIGRRAVTANSNIHETYGQSSTGSKINIICQQKYYS